MRIRGNIQEPELINAVKQADFPTKERILKETLGAADEAGEADNLIRSAIGDVGPEVKQAAVTAAVDTAGDAVAKDILSDAVQQSSPDATRAAFAKKMRTAGDEEAQELTTQVLNAVDPETAQAAVEAAKISQGTLDQIWMLIVKTFSYVLLGATLALFVIVILDVFYPVELAHVQIMLTVFTTVAGILAGFITGQAVGTARERSRTG